MNDVALLVFGFGSFTVGIVVGMSLYRLLWRLDTAGLLAEMSTIKNYNRSLQDEVYSLRVTQEEMRGRIQVLEETNRELNRENRESRRAYSEIAKMATGTD